MERWNDLCSKSVSGGVVAKVAMEKGRRCDELGGFNEQRALEARKCPSFFEASAVNVRGRGWKKARRNKEEWITWENSDHRRRRNSNADEGRDESEFPRIKSRILEPVKRCKRLFFSLLKLVKLIFFFIPRLIKVFVYLFFLFLYLFHYAKNIFDIILRHDK